MTKPPPPPAPTPENPLPPELKPLVQEITQYRNSLGLEDLPQGFLDKLKDPPKWDSNPPEFAINLPEKNKSYGMFVKDALIKIFGPNSTRLAKEAGTWPDNPNFYGFDIGKRKFIISDVIHEQVPLDIFLDWVLHEAIGHGSDPELFTYPPEILVRVEHGKWRALTQCLSVEKQFLNHEYDQVLPQILADIGETIARTVVDNKPLTDILDAEGEPLIKNAILDISKRKGVPPESLKFNKKVYRELGKIIFDEFIAKRISLKGSLKEKYQQTMESGLMEIYAEMVKQAIAHTEEIGNNPEIMEGIREIVSAIRGETANLAEIHESVKNPSKEIASRYQDEKEALKEERANQPTPTPKKLTTEELAKLKEEEEKRKQQQEAVDKFVTEGKIPTLGLNPQELIEIDRYASFLSRYVKLFPELYKGGDFDPESLHIWESREIQDATRVEFVYQIVSNNNIGQCVNEAKTKTSILEKYAHILEADNPYPLQ